MTPAARLLSSYSLASIHGPAASLLSAAHDHPPELLTPGGPAVTSTIRPGPLPAPKWGPAARQALAGSQEDYFEGGTSRPGLPGERAVLHPQELSTTGYPGSRGASLTAGELTGTGSYGIRPGCDHVAQTGSHGRLRSRVRHIRRAPNGH